MGGALALAAAYSRCVENVKGKIMIVKLCKAMACAAACWMMSGCVPLLVGAGTETAVVVAQERSVGNAVDDATILLKLKKLYADQQDKDMLKNVEIKVVE